MRGRRRRRTPPPPTAAPCKAQDQRVLLGRVGHWQGQAQLSQTVIARICQQQALAARGKESKAAGLVEAGAQRTAAIPTIAWHAVACGSIRGAIGAHHPHQGSRCV